MEKSFFSRRGISVATLVAMLASQFAPIGLNMTYAAANDITLTNTNPAGFDGVNVPNFSTTITIATAADILDGSTFDITLPAYLPDIAAGDLDDGFLGFTVTGLGAGASVARLSARVAQVTIATALTAATGDAPFADNDTIVITFTTTADTAGTAAGTVGNTAPTFAIAGTVAGNAVQSAITMVVGSDITLLTAAKSTAAGLITANAPESSTPGQHTVGALATLIAAQAAANATVASPQLTVDGQVTTLNAAIATYNTAIVGIDIIGPVVTLSGAATLTLAYGAVYTELGARWTDVVDGSGAATISGSVNTSIAGTYTLTYQKTDLAGNPSNIVTRTVTVSAQVYSGGSSSSSTPYVPPTVVPPPATNKPAVTQSTIPPSSNPNITQDLFAKSNTDFKKSKIITTPSTLKAGTQINIMRVLPNGKSIKVGTTRVLRNGVIRYTVKTAGKYSFVQK